MSASIPKMIGADQGSAKPQPFVAFLNGMERDKFEQLAKHSIDLKQEYLRYENPTSILQADYEDNDAAGEGITINGINCSFVQAPPPGPEPLHDPIPGEDICEACEDVEVRSLVGLEGGRKIHMGLAAKLLTCSGCSLCRILAAAFRMDSQIRQSDLAGENPDAFVILTSHWATHPPGPREERVIEIAARIIKPPGHLIGESRIRLLSEDAAKAKKSPHMRGRRVGAEANMSLARLWLGECEENHDCSLLGASTKPKDRGENLLVLDIEQLCLIEIPQESRYLIISYVWPRLPSMKLFRNLLEDWKKPNALLNFKADLLNVFQDAIAITAALGERYIWIDQLCMAQDDPALKDYLVNKMDKVYGQAVLNIVIATSVHPEENYRVPGISSPRTIRQEVATIDGLRFVTALPDFSTAVSRTWWATRGWTFQEGVLPKRCLIFHDDQMYFRCCRDARSEDVTAEGNTHFESHPSKPKIRNGGFEHYLNPEILSNISKGNCFEEYVRFVRDYSRRSLTHGGDVLPAFRGVLAVLSDNFKTLFFCGLPMSYFHKALLWYPAQALERRETHVSNDHSFPWPTWSWTGWQGKIDYEYDLLQVGDERLVYQTVCWYRYHPQIDNLMAIGAFLYDVSEQPDPPFAFGLLFKFFQLLRENQTRIIGWASLFKISLKPDETAILELLTDLFQSVPCFGILDMHGDPCGYLPSVDRDWARRYKESPQKQCEMIILSYGEQSAGEEQYTRINLIHSKYKVIGNPMVCFYNIMLIERDSHGIAYRRGVGKIHVDAVNEIDGSQGVYREPCVLG